MLLSLYIGIPNIAFAQAQILQLKNIKMHSQLEKEVCQSIPLDCKNKKSWSLYRVETAKDELYVISALKLYQLNKSKQGIQLINSWDFSAHVPQKVSTFWTTEEDIHEPSKDKLIYPRLFQISANTYAVAVIQSFSEMYSGGSMHEERADFFELLPKHQYQLRFQNIPFSVNRMARACFSDSDIKESKGKCADDENLVLNIQYLKPYTWQMQYHYYRELSPVSDQQALNQRKNYVIQSIDDEIKFPQAWRSY